MARHRRVADGSFAGVVRALISTDRLFDVISSVKMGDHGFRSRCSTPSATCWCATPRSTARPPQAV